ncbi:cytochrome ubiquinol oxidase subunit I [Stackebrandtia nassauensis]|uniref:Cytochrome bd ubiquinol oxidase subunit I n=1 Tax=Stackebrandtia nassauensis (strain DSM 44728 / CIP 108903 / NRRL B-16338 / NBRC 102104 / LLR-40K-21) TaxID=446470 RepID=D3PXP8_STANL|nr:cytochrome ubiquinol oxidase subunit I [Stackebrandtia nassauensis]ADD43378.1 cytochrome bd ubiquinol oxidase subunit I [Stackebrandtia nassauensis DSM 44728]
MDVLDASRWQFAITTVYHFLFVPLTIGLSFLVAGMQSAWVRTNDERWLKLTKLFGKLFLINFAMGVVTGIVQEFQFGMNWSAYSTYVGDVFGAPLAIEGLAAFFLESTFLGLWIFGWDKLPRRVHLACIWIAAFGTALSAYFILVANSFMQWPTGHTLNNDRVELVDFAALLGNKVALITLPHTLAAVFLTSGAFMLAVAMWHLMRHHRGDDTQSPTDTDPTAEKAWRSAAKIGAVTVLVASVAVVVTGDIQGKIMTETQPMKMAAAEALYETEQPAAFSILTIGSLDGTEEVWSITVPGLLSFLGTGSFDGEVLGINDVNASYQDKYGPGDYRPNIPLTYWSFRAMIGLGIAATGVALLALWTLRRGRTPSNRWLRRLMVVSPLLPLAATAFGWIFTETGRQPWIVFTLLKTEDGVSPSVSFAEIMTSLIGFTTLYAVLAVVEIGLLLRYAKAGLPTEPATY